MTSDEKIVAKYVEKIKAHQLTLDDVPPLYLDAVKKALED